MGRLAELMSSLAGQTVLITRSAEDCHEWALSLEAEGANVVVLPCIHIELLNSDELQETI